MSSSQILESIKENLNKLNGDDLRYLTVLTKKALLKKKANIDNTILLELKKEFKEITSKKVKTNVNSEICFYVDATPYHSNKIGVYQDFTPNVSQHRLVCKAYKNKNVEEFRDKMQKRYGEWYKKFVALAKKNKVDRYDLFQLMLKAKARAK